MTVGVPQASVAVAVPRAPLIVAVDGLHPNDVGAPVAVMVGAVTSTVHVAVRDAVVVLPQASVAVNILVCERRHPVTTTAWSLVVTVGEPQASVAVALPRAPSIVAVDGLHASVVAAPVAVIVGAVTSTVHVAVRDAVAVLPQASAAVNILVCERRHPLTTTAWSLVVTVGDPQASVAVALPSAPLIVAVDGLHPSDVAVPVAVMVGVVTSTVQVAVRDAVAVLPQASVAVNILVCERKHPLTTTTWSLVVTVGELQASVAVALPSAPSMVAVGGLHASVVAAPVAVIVGAVKSVVHVAVRDAVAVLPQPSVAVNILVWLRSHPFD